MESNEDKLSIKLENVINLAEDVVDNYEYDLFDNLCEQEENLIIRYLDEINKALLGINRFIKAKIEGSKTSGLFETQVKFDDEPWQHWCYFNTIEAARKNLVLLTDTICQINVRLFKNGCLLEESKCNYFYNASKEVIDQYISGKFNPFNVVSSNELSNVQKSINVL